MRIIMRRGAGGGLNDAACRLDSEMQHGVRVVDVICQEALRGVDLVY